MKKYHIIIAGTPFLITPMVVNAQTLDSVVGRLGDVVTAATPVVVGLALLLFFWGVAKYILAAGDEDRKTEGRSIMVWGVIAIFVILSIFGLVKVLQNTFKLTDTAAPPIPTL